MKIILIANSEVPNGTNIQGELDIELRFVKIRNPSDCLKYRGVECFDIVWMRPPESVECRSLMQSVIRRPHA